VQWTAIATIQITMITADAPQIPAIIATEKKNLCKTIGNGN
jgi:hypothetical protein